MQAAFDLVRGFIVQDSLDPRFPLPDELAGEENHARVVARNLNAQAGGLLDRIQSLAGARIGIPAQT
jgi:hypothetical protein